ncbi:MAG: histidine kinase [Deltaproteobacteria bacterium]|nr:histidine kinase [Deltaproteobacteria bacterium]
MTSATRIAKCVARFCQAALLWAFLGPGGGLARAEPPIKTLAPESIRLFPLAESVYAMAADNRGFIYAGTSRGLFRFDGVAYRRLGERTLTDPITALTVDTNDGLWVGTDTGSVFRYVDGTAQLAHRVTGAVTDLVFTDPRTLWVVANALLWRNTNDGMAAIAGDLQGLSIRSINRIDDNQLWVATNHGLRVCTTSPKMRCKPVGPDIDAETTVPAMQGHVFVDSRQGSVLAKDETATPVSEEVSEGISPPVKGGVPLANGTWLADAEGLAFADREHVLRYRLPTIPVGSSAAAMIQTANGDVWIAIDGQGLIALRTEPEVFVVGLPLEQRPMAAFSVLLDQKGDLWQNTGHSLAHWNNSTWDVHTPSTTLNAYGLRGLAQSRNGDLWVASLDGGALVFHNNTFSRISSAQGQPLPPTNAVFRDSNANIWLSTERGRLKTPEQPKDLRWVNATACAGAVAAMVEITPDEFWIATDHGLCHRRGDSERAFTTAQGLPSDRLLSLLLQNNGDLWIGTKDRGLVLKRRDRFIAFAHDTGPPLTDITAIVDDDHQGLWLATSTGLVKANKADLLSAAEGHRGKIRFLKLGTRDGMRSENFMGWFPPASAKAKDGTLYFPSHAGVVAVPSPEKVQSPPLPQVYLDDVLINGSRQPIANLDLHIAQGDTLEVRYAVPRLRHAHRVQLQHFLEGIDREWQEDHNPEIKYFGLPSGHFLLRLATTTTDRDEQSDLRLQITVHPPWFRTTWFVLACASFLAGTGVLLYRVRLWTIQRRYEAIASERTRIARDMHDTLEQNLVALKLRLEATKRFADEKPTVLQHAAAGLALVDQAMRDARSSIWSLRDGMRENVDLNTQLSVCAGRSLKGTDLAFNLTSEGAPYRLRTQAEQQLVRIVQEGLTNVIKHASARSVHLRLAFRPGGLHVHLRDDGTGLQAETAPGASEGHFGIQGMRERVEHLGGSLQITGKTGEGTEISFFIPSSWRRV